MNEEINRWEEILAYKVTIPAADGTVTMTMQELLEWLETERGFLRREIKGILLSQYNRANALKDEAHRQYAANHFCGGNCASCGEYDCDVCRMCPELGDGGYCDGNGYTVCERRPKDVEKYAEALADWIADFRQKIKD